MSQTKSRIEKVLYTTPNSQQAMIALQGQRLQLEVGKRKKKKIGPENDPTMQEEEEKKEQQRRR
jgi:hypothetical protein